MTSLEKAINLGYLFLTYKPKKTINTCTFFFSMYGYVSIFSEKYFWPQYMYLTLIPNNGFRWCPLGKLSHLGLEQLYRSLHPNTLPPTAMARARWWKHPTAKFQWKRAIVQEGERRTRTSAGSGTTAERHWHHQVGRHQDTAKKSRARRSSSRKPDKRNINPTNFPHCK